MKFSVYGESLASRIRQFFDDLFTSRYVRFLEAELARVRAEKDLEIQALRCQLASVRMPPATIGPANPPNFNFPAMPLSSYEAELAAHNKALEEQEAEEKKNERKQ